MGNPESDLGWVLSVTLGSCLGFPAPECHRRPAQGWTDVDVGAGGLGSSGFDDLSFPDGEDKGLCREGLGLVPSPSFGWLMAQSEPGLFPLAPS